MDRPDEDGTMKAVVCGELGSASNLRLLDVRERQPAAGEVRLRVAAAAVNFADALMVAGRYQVKPRLPFTPGIEVSGEVLDVGEGVAGLRPGDAVIGLPQWGGWAEQVVLPAARVVRSEGRLPAPIAASVPIAYGTAYLGLVRRARLRPGEVLLVLGAAGGVGLAAVEIGRLRAVSVIAAAGSADKLEVARGKGAEHAVDYRREDLRQRVEEITGGRGVDVVFDPVGGAAFDTALSCLRFGGRVVIVGFAGGTIQQIPANRLLLGNIDAVGFYWGGHHEPAGPLLRRTVVRLLDWAREGRIVPHVGALLPLAEAPHALDLLTARASIGKLVLQPASDNLAAPPGPLA